MSDKSNKYGYVGVDIPAQSFGSNKGVFNPAEINELVADNKWTSFGQLELIETKTISSASSAIFTDIKENEYNVHFLTLSNFSVSTYNEFCNIRLFENGVEETASVYQFAYQYNEATGGAAESKSTGSSSIRGTFSLGTGTNYVSNSYSYFYNLGDSAKYSYHTVHSSGMLTSLNFRTHFGSSVLPQTSTVDQIKLFVTAGTFDATASLYGIREYS